MDSRWNEQSFRELIFFEMKLFSHQDSAASILRNETITKSEIFKDSGKDCDRNIVKKNSYIPVPLKFQL